jgi:hypothetical protein
MNARGGSGRAKRRQVVGKQVGYREAGSALAKRRCQRLAYEQSLAGHRHALPVSLD